MALLPPLRECLGGLVTSGLWMEEITTVGRDGQRFDLGRAEQRREHRAPTEARLDLVGGIGDCDLIPNNGIGIRREGTHLIIHIMIMMTNYYHHD